jgi:hypothetical protein
MINNSLKISKYCHISSDRVLVNGKPFIENINELDNKSFLKHIYKSIEIAYSKFFKMDEISKLGFLAVEILLKDINLSVYNSEDVSIVLSNSDSTIDTDYNHQNTINDYENFFPSPSIFVYTLPNIMIGEISIRNGIKGENSFFIVEKFNAEIVVDHINSLFLTGKAEVGIGGWVNFHQEKYEAFIYLASKNGNINHSASEVNKLFNLIT